LEIGSDPAATTDHEIRAEADQLVYSCIELKGSRRVMRGDESNRAPSPAELITLGELMKRRLGFTLVELLVVIGIIALLVSILLPTLGKARQQANLTACMAQMRDVGNAISMYVGDNKGSYPGPVVGQVRLYYSVSSTGVPDQGLATYLWRYFRYPAPQADGSINPAKVFYCPGMRANNAGTYDETQLCTYVLWASYWDPYPWFGYYRSDVMPVRCARIHQVPSISTPIAPMKASQVWEPQLMPMMSDGDVAWSIYQGFTGAYGSLQLAQGKVPSHGGRPETKVGINDLASGGPENPTGVINGPFYIYVDKTAATNPPRNYLFADGHVQTVRRSDPFLPPQFVTKYGPKPTAGWFPALAVFN
jgi:prepilin-type N-terminal cleavage/methylation domain-containing protein/prepilin-type processing-associated H-X9-DG protein